MQKQLQKLPKPNLTKTKKKKPSVLMRVPLGWYKVIKQKSWERRMKMVDLINDILKESPVLRASGEAAE